MFAGLGLQKSLKELAKENGVKEGSYLEDLCPKLAVYLLSSKSASTNTAYYNSFSRWKVFINAQGHCALPANPIHVALYLTHLLEAGSSQHPVNSAIYGIKWAHEMLGLSDPTKNSYVTSLQESAKRVASHPVCKKEPVSSEMIIALCSKFVDCTDLLIVRNMLMILFGFAGFLRFDEISSLTFKDVTIFENHIRLIITRSKTDQYRQGNEVLISKGCTVACPVNMYIRYLSLVGQENDCFYIFRPVFRSKDVCKLIYKNKKLSYTAARSNIVSLLKSVAGNDVNIGLHSLRAGGATEAANASVNDRCLKRHGRWKTDSAKDGYIVDSIEKRLEISHALRL